ncbi:MAG: hypothetical protein IK064_05350 [Clostridia bacterium]|nr:hypothetical protein [Clostridia bacterium]
MKDIDAIGIVNEIDEGFIDSAEKTRGTGRRRPWIPFAAAACFALAAGLIIGAVLHKKAPQNENGEARIPAETETASESAKTPESRPTAMPEEITHRVEASYVEGWGLVMAVENAPVICECVCTAKEDRVSAWWIDTDLELRITRVIRGGLEEGSVVPARTGDGRHFRIGDSYLVFASPCASVFEGKPLYYSVGAVIYGNNGGIYRNDMPDIAQLGYDEILALTVQYETEHPYAGSSRIMGAYCDSDDLAEICRFSDCIVKVRAREVALDAVGDRTSYDCSVIECYSGEAEGSIRVVTMKNALKLGQEYLLLLMTDEQGSHYVISSVKSVIPANSAEAEFVLGLLDE